MSEKHQYVAYYRVSTARQGKSGLGLDAQRHAVESYLASCSGVVLAEYVEVESGRRKDRQELKRAIDHARVTKSKLVIAKLDRLSRSVSITAALMDAPGVEFVCCDNPQANRFTIHILAALAEMEAEMISARTKAALAEAKRRGVKLGNPMLNLCRGSPVAANAAWQQQAQQRAASYLGLVLEAQRGGVSTLQGIADHLNQRGVLTPSGRRWYPATIARLLSRLGL